MLVILAFVFGPGLFENSEDGSTGSARSGQGYTPDSPDSSDSSDSSEESSEESQANALHGLLERNEGNRSGVGEAVRSMITCPGRSGLQDAESVFDDAATERDELVQDLRALELDLLPASMTEDLESGWQASADADRAYAQLAGEVMSGCTPKAVTASSHWQDASGASTRATDAKKDFVSAWNPMAREHGLTTMTWDKV
ncbi:hypothetical protein NKH18_24135 [Streptomyces sp. M10(2022)]